MNLYEHIHFYIESVLLYRVNDYPHFSFQNFVFNIVVLNPQIPAQHNTEPFMDVKAPNHQKIMMCIPQVRCLLVFLFI